MIESLNYSLICGTFAVASVFFHSKSGGFKNTFIKYSRLIFSESWRLRVVRLCHCTFLVEFERTVLCMAAVHTHMCVRVYCCICIT